MEMEAPGGGEVEGGVAAGPAAGGLGGVPALAEGGVAERDRVVAGVGLEGDGGDGEAEAAAVRAVRGQGGGGA